MRIALNGLGGSVGCGAVHCDGCVSGMIWVGVADWEEIMPGIRCEANSKTLRDLIEKRAYAL